MASDSRGQAWMVSQRASLDRESLSAPVQHVAHIASTDWQVDPAGPCQQNLLTKQVPSPCSPTQGLGCRWGSRLAWRASSTKWLTLPFSWGRKHGERLRTHGGLFALLREQPFLAWVPRAPEADGNFCGLNAGLRHAGLFRLAACCLPARSSSAASRPRPIHSCLCSWISLLHCTISRPSPVALKGCCAGPEQGRPPQQLLQGP